MAGATKTVTVKVLGDSRSAQEALRKVGVEAEDSSNRSGRAFVGMRQHLGNMTLGFGQAQRGVGVLGLAVGAGVTAMGGLTIAAAGMGLKTAASMEQARIGFTTMLGSAQKADKFLRQLQQFAAATPFEFPELQTAASSLISVGVNADQVIPIMTTLGNVTSGMGTGSEGVQRATVALQQMIAAQRISAQDLNQLRDAGIPVYDLLSKATGKSTQEVVKLAQSGKLGKKELDQMMHALETGKGLERFNGLMQKQSQSLSGLMSTLHDNINMTLSNLVTPAIPAIKAGLNIVSNIIQTGAPRVTHALGAAFTAVTDFVSGFRNGIDALGSKQSTFAAIGATAYKAFQVVAKPVRALHDGMTDLFEAFRQGDVTSRGFYGAFEKVGVTLRGLAQTIRSVVIDRAHQLAITFRSQVLPAIVLVGTWVKGNLLPAFTQIAVFMATRVIPTLLLLYSWLYGKLFPAIASVAGSVVRSLLPVFTALTKTFRANVMPALIEVWTRFQSWLPTIKSVISVVISVTAFLLKLAAAVLGRVLPPLVQLAGFLIGTLFRVIGVVIGQVVGFIGAVGKMAVAVAHGFNTVRSTVATAMNAVRNVIRTVMDGVHSYIVAEMALWRTVFTTAWTVIRTVVTTAINAVRTVVSSVMRAASVLISGYLSAWRTTFSTAWSAIRTVVSSAVAGIKSIIGTLVSIVGTIGGFFGQIRGVVASKFSDVYRFLRGVPNGILSSLGNLGSLLTKAGEALLSGFLSGITSGFDKVKQFIGGIAGWIKGHKGPVSADALLLVDAGRAIMGGFASGLTAGMGNVSAAVTRWSPVIIQALSALGQPLALLPAVLHRMGQESGGNPNAINLWDSNAKAGMPSQGLMQVIPGTFARYAGPYAGRGILDPLANTYAGLNYALHRYGNIAGPMMQAGGYDSGGWLMPGRHLVENRTGSPEAVLNPQQWATLHSRAGADTQMVAALRSEIAKLRGAVQTQTGMHEELLGLIAQYTGATVQAVGAQSQAVLTARRKGLA